MLRFFAFTFIYLISVSCATLAVRTTVLSPNEKVSLKKGDTLQIVEIKHKEGLEKEMSSGWPGGVKNFHKVFREKVAAKLKARSVKVSRSSPNKMTLFIEEFDRGCGFCRGFFPVFGLGETHLKVKVSLKTGSGTKVILLDKAMQSTGMLAMSDQTNGDMDYVTEKLAGDFVE